MITFAVILAAWTYVSANIEGFPTPSATFADMAAAFSNPFGMARDGGTRESAFSFYTLGRVFSGFLLAAAVGIPVGLALV